MSLFTGFVAIASMQRLWCNSFCFFLPPLIIKLPFIPQNIGPPFHNGYQEIILNIDIFSFCIRPLRYLFTIAHCKKFKYKHKIIFSATIMHIYIKYFSLHDLLDSLTNHRSCTFCLITHALFFVFPMMNEIYPNGCKANSRDISNCNTREQKSCFKFLN